MKSPWLYHRAVNNVVFWVFSAFLLTSCSDMMVQRPSSPANDQSPSIKIINFVPGGNGEVDRDTVETSATVYGTAHTELMLSGIASNPVGGIKTFSLTVSQGGNVLYSAQTSTIPDANNQVPNVLRILGGDGAGGAGVKVAFLIRLSQGASVTATATNFTGAETRITVNYVPLGPLAANISVQPSSIEIGQSASLAWSTSNATDVTLSPPVGTGAISPVGVSPSATTTYTLTAKQPFVGPKAIFPNPPPSSGQSVQDVTKTATATLNVTPAQPATGGISGTYFFDAPGTDRFDIQVVFSGILTSPPGTTGNKTFSIPVTVRNLAPGPKIPINFSAQGLMKGTWRVRAQPSAVAGPIECNVVVPPGLVAMSVAGGSGPKCNP